MTTLSLVVLAAEEAAENELQLLPATAELIWGTVAFALLFLVLAKVAFPKMNAMLEERGARIQGQLEAAERAKAEAEQERRRFEAQLAESRAQANEAVAEARAQAERLRADLVAQAEREAAAIVAKAREDAEAERGRLVADLRAQVATLSVELAGKIVQRELDPAQHRALVDQYINELSGLN